MNTTKTYKDLLAEFSKIEDSWKTSINDVSSPVFRNKATKRELEKGDREKCLSRMLKKVEKQKQEELNILEMIYNSESAISEIVITVEWVKSRTWGMNPKANVTVYKDSEYGKSRIGSRESRFVSGCGYDKESTAIAEALNEFLPVRRLLCKAIDIDVSLPYGIANYSGIPHFSGGVGSDCFWRVFEVLGFSVNHVSGTKTTDVWVITKKGA